MTIKKYYETPSTEVLEVAQECVVCGSPGGNRGVTFHFNGLDEEEEEW